MISFTEYLEEAKKHTCTCWTGYKRKPGTEPCAPGSCIKEESELEEAVNLGSKVTIHAPGKSYHGKTGHVGEIRYGAYKGAPKTYTIDHENGSIQLDKKNIKLHKEESELEEAAVDAKGYKSSTGGLTQKGRDAYNAHGAHLQAPVTTPPSKLKTGSKAANRRKSFCARMSGMEGPMKKPNGEPTRKALALRKWNC